MNSNQLRACVLKAGVAMPALALMSLATPALAQSVAGTASEAEAQEGNAILVTGSRIPRPDLDSPVPVAVISSENFLQDGAQNVSDVINELPQVGIGSTRTNTNFLTSGTGVSTVNLRALGSSRTLTLVNGRRFVSGFAGDSAVDINNIPIDFLERTEIITGGRSAIYGSDAVAGVVNFILRDSFEGFSVRGQTAISDEGDNARNLISVTGGTTFGADDRGNIMVNFSWDKDQGLFSRKREISAQDCFYTDCGPGAYSSYAPQGQFALVDASGDAVAALPGGNPIFSFNPDNSIAYLPRYNTAEYGYNRNGDRYISTPLERYLVSTIANYDVTDSVEAYFEGTFARVTSNSSLEPSALGASTDIFNRAVDPYGMPITNAFIPESVQAAIAAANSDGDPTNDIDAIDFRKRQNDVFDRSNRVKRDTWRAVAGVRGDITSSINFDVSAVYGHLNDYNASEDIDTARYRAALDAIRVGSGDVVGEDIICRDAAARDQGCIPLNPFGYGTVDPRAAAYVQAVVPKSEEITNEQYVFTATIAGTAFQLMGNDVGFAVGGEYRNESVFNDLDILTNTGGNSGNQIPDLEGSFDVWEVFGETNVPLVTDRPGLDYLGLNGAVRYSDYSTIGGVVSWNAGAEYAPIPDLMFRANYAVANRAPNNGELFSAPSETFASVNDPCNNVTATSANGEFGDACRAIPAIAAAIAADGSFSYTNADLQGINGFIGGNTELQEETANTITAGIVYTPSFVPGLSLTVDFYDIELEDAISTLGRSYSIEQCLLTGLPLYCDSVFRDAESGQVTRVDGQLINVAGQHVQGFDVGARYGRSLGLLPDDNLNLSLNYTYTMDFTTQGDPSETPEENAGTFGPAYSTHRALARGSYTVGSFTFGWTTSFTSGAPYLRDFVTGDDATDALNDIDDYWLHDAQLRWNVEPVIVTFNVDNVFDTKPQYLPGSPFGTPTGLETSDAFDVIGRRFTLGLRVGF